jgi:hypothetical protein
VGASISVDTVVAMGGTVVAVSVGLGLSYLPRPDLPAQQPRNGRDCTPSTLLLYDATK